MLVKIERKQSHAYIKKYWETTDIAIRNLIVLPNLRLVTNVIQLYFMYFGYDLEEFNCVGVKVSTPMKLLFLLDI